MAEDRRRFRNNFERVVRAVYDMLLGSDDARVRQIISEDRTNVLSFLQGKVAEAEAANLEEGVVDDSVELNLLGSPPPKGMYT